ncbi:hypothetical protein M378DRAFT_158465 [Amanita muscaria Koide BX008]|uniref:Uncharacterized protein n=1 Tax=Amanita muscaria (strain Koide BX008) TaxID=946122 RepID=A0A0C2XGS0_AMAMK|nr:hypothetical protein M378DRAFT_158465 [Amanita muscaria Koide BX008]
MGGPALEIFKFSLYLFVPVAALIHFGDPAWYRQNVLPYRDRLFPPSKTIQSLPTDPHGIRAELDRIKSERLAKRAAQEDEGKQ